MRLRLTLLAALTGCSAVTDFDQFEPGADMGPAPADGAVDAPMDPDLGPCEEGRAEACNGVDDDCDELVDEGFDFTDVLNCGGCDNVCVASSRAEPVCVDEACDIVCDAGFGDCDEDGLGCETSLDTATDCGGCGVSCAEGQVCSTAGETPTCVAECPEGEILCGTTCADLETDANHCGSCGAACPEPSGGAAACVAFECTLGACDTGFADCNVMPTDGCEVMTAFDPFNCGACDNACSFANGIPSCSSGSCALAGCVSGYEDCDGDDSNGCEAQLGTVETCTACGDSCHTIANGTRACGTGGCEYACDTGFVDCNGDITDPTGDGCETQLGTNSDCGSCGDSCSGTDVCSEGGCVSSCGGDTPDSCSTGCTNLDTDPSNCGSCGMVCTDEPNSSPTCSSGSCGFSCDPGFGDCTSDAGCETPLNTISNCGTCGTDCEALFPNATVACMSGSCVQTGCDPGYADCTADDGCETPITTVDDCGACNNTCTTANGSPACTSTADGYACTIGACDDGFAQCDADNDCEAQEATYPDSDGDAYGDSLASSILECPGASSRVTNALDCDDTNGAINPDAEERLNGEDDDCDGAVDEGLVSDEICNRADDDSDGQIDEGLLQAGPATRLDSISGVIRLRAARGSGNIGVAIHDEANIRFFAHSNPETTVTVPPPPDAGKVAEDFDVCWDGFRYDVFLTIDGSATSPSELQVRRYAADGTLVRTATLDSRAIGTYSRIRCVREPEAGVIGVAYTEPSGTLGNQNVVLARYTASATSLNLSGRDTVAMAPVDGLAVSNYRNGFVVAHSENGGAIRTRTVTSSGSLGTVRTVDSDTASEIVADLRPDPASGRQLLTVFDAGETFAIALAEGGARVAGTSFVRIGTEVPTYARSSGDTRFGIIDAPNGEVRRYAVPGLVDQAPAEGPLAVEGARVSGDAIGFPGGTYRYAHYFFTSSAIYSQSITCPTGTP